MRETAMKMNRGIHQTRVRLSGAAALLTILGWSWISPQQTAAKMKTVLLPGSLVVTITSPASGSTVAGTIAVDADVSAVGVLVSAVQFTLDGANLGAEDTTAPYSIGWDTATAGNGSHTLTAVARDALGPISTSDPVTVAVSNAPPTDTTPPTVSISSPASGATVSGTIAISATASDNVGVAGVQFYLDGSALGSEDTASPYATSWNTASSANSSHTLNAVARDAAGNRTTSAGVTVTVSNNSPPTRTRYEESAATLVPAGAWASITSTDAGATLSGGQGVYAAAAGATATFSFSGTGVSWIGLPCEICGIAKVYLDGALAATVDTFIPTRPASSSALYVASNLAAASHTLVVQVTGTQNPSSGGASVLVDAYDVEGGTSGGGGQVTRYEENAPSVSYVGSWLVQSRADLSGGSIVESSDSNGTATLTFNGTAVSWIGFKAQWGGIAQVYIDGAQRATVDTYSPVDQSQAVIYTATGLAAGAHTLTVKVTGTWSSSGCCAWVAVDAFDVTSGP